MQNRIATIIFLCLIMTTGLIPFGVASEPPMSDEIVTYPSEYDQDEKAIREWNEFIENTQKEYGEDASYWPLEAKYEHDVLFQEVFGYSLNEDGFVAGIPAELDMSVDNAVLYAKKVLIEHFNYNATKFAAYKPTTEFNAADSENPVYIISFVPAPTRAIDKAYFTVEFLSRTGEVLDVQMKTGG